MSQLSLLMVTGKMKAVPQAELGKMLKLERSTVTRDLTRLVDKGFLVKSGTNSRPVVEMTDAGAEYTERIIPDWYNATQEAKNKLGADGDLALNLVLQNLMK